MSGWARSQGPSSPLPFLLCPDPGSLNAPYCWPLTLLREGHKALGQMPMCHVRKVGVLLHSTPRPVV